MYNIHKILRFTACLMLLPILPALHARDTATRQASTEKEKDILAQALRGNFDNVEDYLKNNGNPNIQDEEGLPLLLVFVLWNSTEMAQLLIENGADVKLQGNYGWSPLHLAARFGSTEITQLLIENGAVK